MALALFANYAKWKLKNTSQDGFGKAWFLGLFYARILLPYSLHERYPPISGSVSYQQRQ